ncbi:MAG: PQQ-binding-like beta-propeller repeat protein [Alphaproteobacteria bacterium]|nr:PQQ-binding-like beta-propeller repeat protein [Alphaproteobacteria bacterium]
MTRFARLRRPAALAAALLLAGCGIGDWFGGEDEPRLPGERVSVLELAQSLEPDPQVADLEVVIPPPQPLPDWPVPGGTPTHAPQHIAMQGPQIRAMWESGIGVGAEGEERLLNPPIIVGDRIFATDATGHVTALSAGSGNRLWRVLAADPTEDSEPLGGGIAYGDGLLFVTTGFGEIVAMDPANGGLVWREATGSPIRAAPAVADGRVYVVTVDNQLEAYAARDGSFLWRHTGILEPAALLGGATPAVAPGVVVAAYSSGEIFALRPESGRPAWFDSLTAIRRAGALAALADIRGMPVIHDDMVIAVSHSGRMAAFDLRRGVRIWEQEIGGINTPWVAGNFIFVISRNAELVALTRDTGRIRWVTPLPRWVYPEEREDAIIWSGPVLAGGVLMLVGSNEEGLLIAPESGEILNRFDLPESSHVPPVVANGTLYILFDDGTLAAYRG